MEGLGPVWIAVGVAAFIFLDVLFVELRRVAREANRITKRVSGYANLPVLAMIAPAQADVERVIAAVDAVTPLIARAQLALTVIRTPALWRDPPADYLPKGSSPG